MGSIPGLGTKIPHAMQCSPKEKKKYNNGDMEKNPHGLITLLKKIEGAGFEDGHQKSANIIIT